MALAVLLSEDQWYAFEQDIHDRNFFHKSVRQLIIEIVHGV